MVDKDLLVFLHIFKTGGTSLYNLMSKIYGTGYVLANPPDIKRRVTPSKKALAGHIPLTPNHLEILHSLNRDITYITILRDPIDRVISDYHWVRNYDFEYKMPRDASLIELLEKGFSRGINVMTTYLSGSADRHNPDLELAKERLRAMVSVVGIMEEYPSFLEKIKTRFRWPEIPLGHAKLNPQRPPTEDPATVEAIKHYNQADIKLYEFAKGIQGEGNGTA